MGAATGGVLLPGSVLGQHHSPHAPRRILQGISSTWSGKPPRSPRPARTLLIFNAVERGLRWALHFLDCMRCPLLQTLMPGCWGHCGAYDIHRSCLVNRMQDVACRYVPMASRNTMGEWNGLPSDTVEQEALDMLIAHLLSTVCIFPQLCTESVPLSGIILCELIVSFVVYPPARISL